MKWYRIGIGIFLLVGIIIAFFSLYKASIDGLMRQLGLVGSDFSVSVVHDQLRNIQTQATTTLKCDLPSRMRGTVKFFLASDQEQGQQAFYLGQERIKCGASMLADGNVEVGTYEIVKGFGYLEKGYQFVSNHATVDNRVCEGMPTQELNTMVQQILEATSGKVFEIVWDSWRSLLRTKDPVEQVCLDQAMRSR